MRQLPAFKYFYLIYLFFFYSTLGVLINRLFPQNVRLNNNGGFLAQDNVCHNTTMPNMGANTHLERLYSNVGHGLKVFPNIIDPNLYQSHMQFQELMFERVRSDILHWINLN